jgi:hypothetical protein
VADLNAVPAAFQHQKELDAIEKQLAEVNKLFEQYFLGFERLPPIKERDELHKRILKLKGENPRNTGVKFRLNSSLSKFLSYDRMWQRTLKEIEEGTYKRDIIRAKKLLGKSAAQGKSGASADAAGKPAGAAASRSQEALKSLSDDKLHQLYDVYMEAKKRCNEPTQGLTYEAVADTIKKQVPELIKKHNAKAIDFKVVIKGGRALLKAVPRE